MPQATTPGSVTTGTSATVPAPDTKPGHGIPAEKWESTFGPRSRWRKGICECFDIFCFTPLCLMSCCGCTHTVVLGQLMERMGLDWSGQYLPTQAHKTCRVVATIWVLYVCLSLLGLWIFVWPFIIVWLIVISTRLRGAVRSRFSIPSEYCHCCNGSLEDCLCTCFCSCCATIQMARQTHNEYKYPYNNSANTGLPMYAPVIFEEPPPMDRQPSAPPPPPQSASATPPPPPTPTPQAGAFPPPPPTPTPVPVPPVT